MAMGNGDIDGEGDGVRVRLVVALVLELAMALALTVEMAMTIALLLVKGNGNVNGKSIGNSNCLWKHLSDAAQSLEILNRVNVKLTVLSNSSGESIVGVAFLSD